MITLPSIVPPSDNWGRVPPHIRKERQAPASDRYLRDPEPEFPSPDSCTLEGAKCVAARIEAYRKARGFAVETSVVPIAFHKSMREATFAIRSNLINGMPRSGS